MDCVSCEKCRLWGKLQVTGLGTALKVLFSFGKIAKDYSLTRGEIVALVNAFGRISESIQTREMFRIMLERRDAAASSKFSPQEAQDFIDGIQFGNPSQRMPWLLGLLVFVFGIFNYIRGYKQDAERCAQKRKEMEDDYSKKSQ